jgi:hypothetical protein
VGRFGQNVTCVMSVPKRGGPVSFDYTQAMSTILSPIESEFATSEEAAAYERWLHHKVQKSMDDTRPNIPHDLVLAKTRALLTKKRKAATSNSKS